MNPAPIIATRHQSCVTHWCVSRITSALPSTPVVELAAANNAELLGQKTTTVKTHTAKMSAADNHNQARYPKGVFHPLSSAPKAATNVASDVGMKNLPGSTGNRGP
jgi:hypothetical protein